jgi:pyridoxamine 5'-phosphate oxidase
MEHTENLTSGNLFAVEDPFALFTEWMGEAAISEPNDPNAMALATVDESGLPDVRIVLLKGVDERGFVFFTNTESAKGRQLAANMQAAVDFHWKTLGRQVRVRGPVEQVTTHEADEYFASRPRLSQIGAWASQQSRELAERAIFEAEIARLDAEFGTGAPPRPSHWSGYRILPLTIEFWHNRPYRLHDRLQFVRTTPDAPFARRRLYP